MIFSLSVHLYGKGKTVSATSCLECALSGHFLNLFYF